MPKQVIQRKSSTCEDPKVLLIVDDCEQVANTAKRFLVSEFDRVLTATSPKEATKILKTEPVSHILCDLNFGPRAEHQLLGFVLADQWRFDFPELDRIVIFTCSDVSDVTLPLAVDGIVSKSRGLAYIADVLLNRGPVRG